MQPALSTEFIHHLRTLCGSPAIYMERGQVLDVVIKSISATQTRLSLVLRLLGSFDHGSGEPQDIWLEDDWEHLRVSPKASISVAWRNALLITDLDSIRQIQVATAAARGTSRSSALQLIELVNTLR